MRVKYKIEKPFGPAGSATGITMFIAGLAYVYFSLVGIILIVLGAFIGFTSVCTWLDAENKKIRFSNMLFGFIPTGKWMDIKNDMKIGPEQSRRGFRTYSRGMRINDVVVKDIRIMLYGSDNKKIGPIIKCKSSKTATEKTEELSELLGLEIY